MSSSIRFACPSCGKQYKAQPELAGKPCNCKCGQRMAIPHPCPENQLGQPPTVIDWSETSAPPPSKLPQVPEHLDFDAVTPLATLPQVSEQFEYDAVEDDQESQHSDRYDQSAYRDHRKTNMGAANRIVAGIGAALLLIGLFLPMVNTPFGIWMSFVDLPWKAISVGLNAAAIADEESREPHKRTRTTERSESSSETSGKSTIIMGVAVSAVLYPICIFSTIIGAFFLICVGRSSGGFVLFGGISLLSTILYGSALLALSAHKDFRVIMAFTSPGFGWGVLLVGALALTGSGMIRAESRE